MILDKLIRGYIDSAEPVSSEFLEKKYHFGICPATIRNEMQKLTDGGLLFQPHTSSGRVPTDKGYRFFVDGLSEKEISETEEIFKIDEILKKGGGDVLKWADNLTKFLAEESSSFVLLNLLKRDFILKEGWEEILEEPEFEEKSLVSDFIRFLGNFEKNIVHLDIDAEIKIYIGKENPFSKINNFSMILTKCYFSEENEGIISLVGPKRMNYDRNINLMKSFKNYGRKKRAAKKRIKFGGIKEKT